MLNLVHIKNDLRQILRDPVMGILLFAPVLLIGVFKVMVIFLIPFLNSELNFDFTPYYIYLLAGVLIVISGMLGIVTGFMMLDDKDGNIAELMSVTPLGRGGYLANRVSLASFLTFIYSVLTIYVLNIVEVKVYSALLLSILCAVYAAIIGLLIFFGADDKVKGLTFAKGLNVLGIFAFSDLFALKWFSAISVIFPTYWITSVLKSQNTYLVLIIGTSVHLIWLLYLIYRFLSKK